MRALVLLLCLTALGAAAQPPGEDTPRGVDGRFLLQDHRGNAVTDEDFRGRWLLITFGYTHCPDICPTTLVEMAAVMEKLGERAERVQPIFISVDPERDTPEHLAEYVGYFHPRFIGLTGTRALVEHAAFNFKVRFRKVENPNDPGRYSMDHSAGIYLMDPQGGFVRKFGYGEPPAAITESLTEYLGE